jgi:general secretion pathway protein G
MKKWNLDDVQRALGTTSTTRLRRARGMSLLEIMVVITLIGLVTAAIGVAVIGQLGEGQAKTARNQAYQLAESVKIYKLNNGSYPTTGQGLSVLVTPPKGKPIMESLPKDPWGADYIYVIPGQKNPASFDIRSKGNDGQEGTEDDVGNWPE